MRETRLNGYKMPARLQPRQDGTWEPLRGPRARRRAQRQPDPVTAGMRDLVFAFLAYCGAGVLSFGVIVLLLWWAGNWR